MLRLVGLSLSTRDSPRRLKVNSVVGLLLVVTLAMAGFAAAEFAGMEVHRDWASLIVYDRDTVRFRSLTQYTAGGEYVALVMDRLSDDCDTQYVTINLVMDFPAPESRSTGDMIGLFRVDENSRRKITYAINYKKGDLIAYALIKAFEREDVLLQDLKSGQQVRMRLGGHRGPLELRFSLAGFTAAIERTLALCLTARRDRAEVP